MFRAIAHKDFDALGALLADGVTFEIVGSGGPMAARAEWRERVVEAARRNFAQVEEQRPEILSVVAQGDTVVVGREYEAHWMN